MELITQSAFVSDHRDVPKGGVMLLHTRSLAVGIDVGQAHDPTVICVA